MQFLKTYKRLLPMLLFTNMLVLMRMVYSGTGLFLFIPWNLLLAVVPLYFAFKFNTAKSPFAAWLFFGFWLLFFPNAMYIVTDLFHLKERPGVPQWYDLLVLFAAALTGLIIGFLSLMEIERNLHKRMDSGYLPLAQLLVFFLCGYGIYLGRYLRWNSWDVIADPFSLLHDIFQEIVHPFRNKECWLLTAFFGLWLYIVYRYFRRVKLH